MKAHRWWGFHYGLDPQGGKSLYWWSYRKKQKVCKIQRLSTGRENTK